MYIPCPLLLPGGGCVPSGQRLVTGDTLEDAALSLADPVTVCVCVDKKATVYCVFSRFIHTYTCTHTHKQTEVSKGRRSSP